MENYVEVIKKIQADPNDEESVNALVRDYWAYGVRIAKSVLMQYQNFDSTVVEDLLQNSWIKVLRNINSLTDQKGFAAWYSKIVTNTCIDYLRSSSVRFERSMPQVQNDEDDFSSDIEIIDDTIEHQPEMAYDQQARKAIIEEVLKQLSPEQRQVIVMRYYEGLSMKDISERLGIPMSTVEGRSRVASVKIRDSVTEIQKRDDIKLYNLSPLPFFIWLLRYNEETIKIPRGFVPKIMHRAGTAPRAVKKGTGTHAKAAGSAASSAAKKAGASVLTKIIAGAAAAAVAFSTGYAAVSLGVKVSRSRRTADAETADHSQSQNNADESGIKESPESVEMVEWAVEPQFAFTKVKEMLPWFIPYGSIYIRKEKIGYPEDWEYNATGQRLGEFTSNAIEVMQGTRSGVYDYSGHELYPITLRKDVIRENARSSSAIEYGYLRWVLQEDRYKMFTPDFKSIVANDVGDYGLEPGPEEMKVINKKIVAYNTYDHTYHDAEYSDGTYCLMNEYDSNNELIGKAIIDGDGNYVAHVEGSLNSDNWIVNKMIRVSRGDKYAFQSAVTGEIITDFIYDDAKFFMDGYAPVKRNGRWGYIDENGNEVTDIVFEDASMLYEGKAYVSVDGVYGVIDLVKTLQQGIDVTFESTRISGELMIETDRKKAEMLTKIGFITVKVDELDVRKDPALDSPRVLARGAVKAHQVFDVYAIEKANGFTWYEIDEDMWIADDGTWLTYIEQKEPVLHGVVGN